MRQFFSWQFMVCLVFPVLFSGCNRQASNPASDYPVSPVPFTSVALNDHFWLPRILTNTAVTIPIAFKQSEETGRIKNFEVAGGLADGSFCSIYPFDDSDVFKIMEGAAYSLMIQPDPVLEAYLDSLIQKISLAQERDGYLYTNRTILGDSAHEWAGSKRWEHVHEHSHELYNAGHMYEAAVAHFQATGKRSFLNIALKNADLVDRTFGWGKIENYPGHQEIEIGLVKLYRATGEQRYLNLAKFFLDVRGPDGWDYNQAHQKVIAQKEPVGHAVRALYMYSAMADIAALMGDTSYLRASEAIWKNLITKKLYITGGVGQSGGNEGFGPDYELPNMTAYCETCASIAHVFWNHRMFLLSGESKYYDVLERTLYNALISGVAVSGDLFFYPNPLESNGQHHRKEWFGCACCPSNISRFLPSLPGYIYAVKDDAVYINLYITNTSTIATSTGDLKLSLHSDYPWQGAISIAINADESSVKSLYLRIPGWSAGQPVPGDLYAFSNNQKKPPVIRVNGEAVMYAMINGYAVVERSWGNNDLLELEIPMPVRKIKAHEAVAADRGRIALQRGPLVYCLEEADNHETPVRHVTLGSDPEFDMQPEPDLFGGIQSLSFDAYHVRSALNGDAKVSDKPAIVKAIPYAYWANRGAGQMLVWIPENKAYATPEPAPTLAYRSEKNSSGAKGDLNLLSDQYVPENSNDHAIGYIHWWPQQDTTVWLTYTFDQPEKISRSTVYWFDDGPHGGCRIPETWRLYYQSEGAWYPVTTPSGYAVSKDSFDSVSFQPVMTRALKLEITLQPAYSTGVHEWTIN